MCDSRCLILCREMPVVVSASKYFGAEKESVVVCARDTDREDSWCGMNHEMFDGWCSGSWGKVLMNDVRQELIFRSEPHPTLS
jgi:hypothetical protein